VSAEGAFGLGTRCRTPFTSTVLDPKITVIDSGSAIE
jgi:hypothetical protein